MLTRERLLEVFPEIGEVENPEWKEICIRIWQDCFEMSGWDDILDAPNSPEIPSDSLIRHTRGVLKGSFALARAQEEFHPIPLDYDRLRVICILHDVCKLVEIEKDETGYHKSRTGLTYPHGYFSGYFAMKYGLPDAMCASILNHSQFIKNEPPLLEGVIMFYADMADADTMKYSGGYPLLINYCKI